MTASADFRLSITFFLLISFLISQSHAAYLNNNCQAESGSCINKSAALPLKIIAIASILITSMIGVCLPLFSTAFPALQPDKEPFIIVKAFSAGVILATGFMHVLPDSFDNLWSDCLVGSPWHKFPFTGLLTMASAIVTLMVDSLATSAYTKSNSIKPEEFVDIEMVVVNALPAGHFQGQTQRQSQRDPKDDSGAQLLRYRLVATFLELGIVVHSVVIGLSLGASNNTCTIKTLVAALCFHQMFEGMGLGGCILQAEYKFFKKAVMVFFFSVTTPFGIALGIALSNVYRENSPNSLITVGLLDAAAAGLLIYMALVDLLAADFMGPKLQGSIMLQLKCYVGVFLGAGGMSIMARWA